MKQGIISDIEETIIHTAHIWHKADLDFLRGYGIGAEDVREELEASLNGRSIKGGIKILKKRFGLQDPMDLLFEKKLGIVKELFHSDENMRFVNEVEEYIEMIRENGYRICMATALDIDLIKIVDARFKLSKIVGEIYSIADVNDAPKERPDIFSYAAEQMGVKSKDTIVVEDSPYGIWGANQAEAKTLGITTMHKREELYHADAVIDSYAEVNKEFLERLFLQEKKPLSLDRPTSSMRGYVVNKK